MDSLQHLLVLANGLLKGADVGQEYTMEYVVKRLEASLDEYPHDPVIRSMAAVLTKQAKNGKLTTSQKELYNVYNHFAGLSANSMVKEVIGDILYPIEAQKATVGSETVYTHRSNTPDLSFKVEHNPLENLFDKNAGQTSYYEPALAKLGKAVLVEELTNIGVPPTDVKATAGIGENSAIVYDAIFTNKLGTAHVPMFVEVTRSPTGHNKILAPTHFYSNSQFIQLTAENLNKCIVEKAQPEEIKEIRHISGVHTASSVISPSFSFEEDGPKPITIDRVPMPEVLKDLASFEQALIDSSTSFAPELVRTAKALCTRELNNMGFSAQVSLAEASDNCIICAAELDSAVGKIEIKLPVEIINSRPQIPALFYNESTKDKIYDFSKNELSQYLTNAKLDSGQILRYSNDFFNMSYNQLKEEILTGAANKDYVRAESALNRIEEKFPAQHSAALTDYAKYLTHMSVEKEEQPKHKCRLLITKGSIGPRCGHYNVSINRVATDEKGNCELLDRKAKYDNLAESTGTMMRNNKITLT